MSCDQTSVSIGDFPGTTVTKLKAAAAELASRGGGTLLIPPGSYELASAELVTPVELTDNVTVEGCGSKLTITGTLITSAVFRALNVSNIEIRNISCIGNSQADAYVNGCFFFYTKSTSAAQRGVRVRNVHLENFKAMHWIYIANQDENTPLRDVLIEHLTSKSISGNYTSNAITHNASVICIQGGDYDSIDQAYVDNVVIRQVDCDCNYMKTGIILYHSVCNAILEDIIVRNAGFDAAFANDKGSYGLQIYDKWGNGRGVDIRRVEVSAKSCGIYVAGFRDILIDGIIAHGQTDIENSTLPKGAVVFNGARDYVLRNARIYSCAFGLAMVGPSIGGYRTNASIEKVQIYDAVTRPVIISPFAGVPMEGVAIKGSRFVGANRAADIRVSSGDMLTINDFTVTDCHFEATGAFLSGSYGFDAYALNVTHASAQWCFERCTFVGADVGIRIREMSGRLTMRNCRAPCIGQAQALQLYSCTNIDLYDVEAIAGTGGVAFNLGSVTGRVSKLRSVSATTAINGLGSAKPTHSGAKGDFVQNVDYTIASTGDGQTQIAGWRCQGGPVWRPVVETVNSA